MQISDRPISLKIHFPAFSFDFKDTKWKQLVFAISNFIRDEEDEEEQRQKSKLKNRDRNPDSMISH